MHSDNFITFFKLCNIIYVDLHKNPKRHMYGGLTPLHSSHPTYVSERKFKVKKEKKNQKKTIPFPFLFEIKMSFMSNCTVNNAW